MFSLKSGIIPLPFRFAPKTNGGAGKTRVSISICHPS
jgi:hypothetical protein